MNYYFENYVDSGALFAFLDKLGLVATQASDSVGYTILNAFGLIVSSPEKAYEVGFGVFNMLGAVVQFFGVIFLSGFLANRFGKKSVFIVCLALTAVFTAFLLSSSILFAFAVESHANVGSPEKASCPSLKNKYGTVNLDLYAGR